MKPKTKLKAVLVAPELHARIKAKAIKNGMKLEGLTGRLLLAGLKVTGDAK